VLTIELETLGFDRLPGQFEKLTKMYTLVFAVLIMTKTGVAMWLSTPILKPYAGYVFHSFYLAVDIAAVLIVAKLAFNFKKFRELKFVAMIVAGVALKLLLLYLEDPGLLAVDAPPLWGHIQISFETGNEIAFEGAYHSRFKETYYFFVIIVYMLLSVDNFAVFKKIVLIGQLGFAVPTAVFLFRYPEVIGNRMYNPISEHTGGGPLWQIGVVGFVSVFWMGLAVFNYCSRREKLLIEICSVIIIIGGLAGVSRSLIISMAFSGLLFFVLISRNRTARPIIIFVLILLGVAVFVQNDLAKDYLSRFSNSYEDTEVGRYTIWRSYLSHFPEYFLTGAPSKGYRLYGPQNLGPHNTLINWWCQFGLLSGVGFILMMYGLIRQAVAVRRLEKSDANQLTFAAIITWVMCYLSSCLINETGFLINEQALFFGMVLAAGKIFATVRQEDGTIAMRMEFTRAEKRLQKRFAKKDKYYADKDGD